MWYLYEDGFWRAIEPYDQQLLNGAGRRIAEHYDVVWAEKRKVIWDHMSHNWDLMLDPADLNVEPYLVCENGTLDVRTGELLPHSPEHMTTRKIDIEHRAGATCPEWVKMLDDMLDNLPAKERQQTIDTLQEWFGIALLGGAAQHIPRALRQALFLYGPPYTGKSTVLNVLQRIIGINRVVRASVHDVNSNFGLAAFIGAGAWITEEVAGGSDKPVDTARLKCLITGEAVNVSRKFDTDVPLRFCGPVAWAANSVPNFMESSAALYERIMVCELERSFTKAEARARFGSLKPEDWLEMKDEYPGILQWAIEGYQRAIKRGEFDPPAHMRAAGESLREQNDPIFAFLTDCCEEDPSVANSAATLSYTAMAYIKQQHGSTPRRKKIASELKAAIPGVFRNARLDRENAVSGKPRRHRYEGLRLNKSGLRYFAAAQTDYDGASDLTANDPLLGG